MRFRRDHYRRRQALCHSDTELDTIMSIEENTERTVSFVKLRMLDAEGGHDWWHVYRVWRNAKFIAAKEGGVDLQVVELGALLHDVADAKFHGGNEEEGPRVAREFLTTLDLVEAKVEDITNIVKHVSFRHSLDGGAWSSPELAIVQDADRLDAIGAVGIARAFSFGGYKGRPLYDPDVAPNLNMSKAEYGNKSGPTVNHFYEKLLLIKERMNTATGKALAAERHAFMEVYLSEFLREWQGPADRPG